jgi:HNH endonuclease
MVKHDHPGFDAVTRARMAELQDQLLKHRRLSRSIARQYRAGLIKAHDGQCYACRTAHPSILQIHHADPVQELGSGDIKDLYPLCPNCHAYVHLLRRTRANPARREVISSEVRDVHQGWDRPIEVLLWLADTESTVDKMRAVLTQPQDEGDK